ncbi:MAG: arginase family protein, partial [Candidatus Micrarchaeia archaeon]
MRLLHARPPHNFAGVFESDWRKARVAVLPVPYDGTASWKSGARNGPAAIIEASRNMEWFDEELGEEIAQKIGFFTLEELEPDAGGPEETVARVEEAVKEILEAKKLPVILGGEHSITVGVLRALAERDKGFSVLALDAHADLRGEYEGSPFSHACAMRRAREIIGGA